MSELEQTARKLIAIEIIKELSSLELDEALDEIFEAFGITYYYYNAENETGGRDLGKRQRSRRNSPFCS